MLRCLWVVLAGGLAVAAAAQTSAQVADIAPELWDRPRTGAAVLAQEPIRRAVQQALANADAQLVIHHGPGQETQVQAEELKSWLAALAIDPRRVALRGDVAAGSPMKIEIVP